MLVAKLTESEKDELIGKEVQSNWYFNPVQDCDGNWIISQDEVFKCINPSAEWVKSLPLIEWCQPNLDTPSVKNYVGS